MMLVPGKDYQIALVREAQKRAKQGHTRQILSMPTGSGKTWVALAWGAALGDCERVLWVVPNSLIRNTVDGIHALDPDLPVRVLRPVSGRRASEGVWGAATVPAVGLLIVGWDSLVLLEAELSWWMGGVGAAAEAYAASLLEPPAEVPKWQAALPRYPRPSSKAAMVLDEAHYGKAVQRTTLHREQAQPWARRRRVGRRATAARFDLASRAAVAARLAAGATAVLPMTASTITERRSDIYGVLRLVYSPREVARLLELDGAGYESDFRVAYCGAFQGEYGLTDGEPTDTAALLARLSPLVLSPDLDALRAHFLPIVTSAIKVPLVPWEPALIARLGRRARGRRKKAALLRIRSAWAAVIRVARSHPNEATLIFTEYRQTARILARVLQCPVITGATPDREREAIKAAHRRDGGPLVATVYALGHGHNLQYVAALVCAEIPVRLDLFLQAVGRGQRLLRSRPLELGVVVVEQTADSDVLATWSRKVAQTEVLTTHDTSHAGALVEDGLTVDWASVFSAMSRSPD